jgi:muconolactone delta-isomerase
VQFFVRFEVTQPANVSNADLVAIWQREAAAALGAIEAGAIKHAWKVAGQRVVLGVVEVPSHEDLDRALAGLPIIRELGSGVKTEALPIYDYATFAADLNEGAHGGA